MATNAQKQGTTTPAAPEKGLIVREVYHQGDLARLQADLATFAEKFNFLSSVQIIEWIPDFHSISAVRVPVDVRTMDRGGEVYEIGWAKEEKDKRYSLAKSAVERCAMAAGAEIISTIRTDDRSDPHYCEFRAWALVPDVSTGRSLRQPRSAEIDLRDGSDLCKKMIREAEKTYERKLARATAEGWKTMPEKTDPMARIAEMRATIVRRCETAAILRALKAGLCIRPITGDGLKKPFLVLRLVETGRCDDPRMQQAYRQMALARMAGASDALFGFAGKREREVVPASALPVAGPPSADVPSDEDIADFADPEPAGYTDDPFEQRR